MYQQQHLSHLFKLTRFGYVYCVPNTVNLNREVVNEVSEYKVSLSLLCTLYNDQMTNPQFVHVIVLNNILSYQNKIIFIYIYQQQKK